MPDAVEVAIEKGLLDRLNSLAEMLTPVMPVAHPNVEFPGKDANGDPLPMPAGGYLRASFLPIPTVNRAFQVEEHGGVFQVSIFWPQNRGEPEPAAVAAQIIAHFRRLAFTFDGVVIRVVAPPYRSPAFLDVPWLHMPVSIRYFAHVVV